MASYVMFAVLHASLAFGLARNVVEPRSSIQQSGCTVTQFEGLASATESCKEIVISNLEVPAGQMLSMTKLKKGAKITFAGRTV